MFAGIDPEFVLGEGKEEFGVYAIAHCAEKIGDDFCRLLRAALLLAFESIEHRSQIVSLGISLCGMIGAPALKDYYPSSGRNLWHEIWVVALWIDMIRYF